MKSYKLILLAVISAIVLSLCSCGSVKPSIADGKNKFYFKTPKM